MSVIIYDSVHSISSIKYSTLIFFVLKNYEGVNSEQDRDYLPLSFLCPGDIGEDVCRSS